MGFYSPTQWPLHRGFDTFLGLITDSFDYNTHECCNNGTDYDEDSELFDLHMGMENYEYDDAECDRYSTNMFAAKAVNTITTHGESGSSNPLFIYLAYNAPHATVSLPDWTEDGLDYTLTANYTILQSKLNLTWAKRKTYAAALNIIDEQTKRVYKALDENGYFGGSHGDTTIVVTSDNGAPSKQAGGVNGGNNWPLRGEKGSNWDGGLRVPAFVWSTLIPHHQRGVTIDSLFHSTDWMNTLVGGVAGINVTVGDGYNMW